MYVYHNPYWDLVLHGQIMQGKIGAMNTEWIEKCSKLAQMRFETTSTAVAGKVKTCYYPLQVLNIAV